MTVVCLIHVVPLSTHSDSDSGSGGLAQLVAIVSMTLALREYHFFDAILIPSWRWIVKQLLSQWSLLRTSTSTSTGQP